MEGTEFLSQTQFFFHRFLCNPMSWTFQIIHSVGLDSLGLKNQRFTSSGCEDVWIRNFEFVVKTQFKVRVKCNYL